MSIFSNLLKSEFSKNVLILMTGTTIAQAIPIAITPILTRLYTPDDFGLLAIFLAFTAIIGSVINGKYELAIMLPKSDKEALGLVKISFYISLILSTLCLLIVILFKHRIAVSVNEVRIENWLFLVPLSVFLIGAFTVLNVYNNRIKGYKRMSYSMISKTTGMSIVQLGLGFINNFSGGLIVGQFMSYFFGNMVLAKSLKGKGQQLYEQPLKDIRKLAVKYIDFPKYSVTGVLLNSISLNINNFLITALFNTKTLGFYSLTNKILGLPSIVFGSNISTIYFQSISDVRQDTKKRKKIFLSTLYKLVGIAIPTFTVLFFIVKPVFTFLFGAEWIISGVLAQILIPMLAIRFVSSALSPTIDVFEKQFFLIVINIVLLGAIVTIFFISKMNNYNYESFFKLTSVVLSGFYFIFIFIYYRFVVDTELKNI